MSWRVFIGSVISKPKIRLLVYRGSFALICEPVYIQSLPNVHTEPCWLCAQKGSQESGVALGNLSQHALLIMQPRPESEVLDEVPRGYGIIWLLCPQFPGPPGGGLAPADSCLRHVSRCRISEVLLL